jgi:hypothetical protein
MKEKIIVLAEANDHEGETWFFYMRHTPELQQALEKVLSKIQSPCIRGAYTISVRNLDLSVVKELPDNTGYMSTHNIVHRPLDIQKLERVDLDKDDTFYKGGIQGFELLVMPKPKKAKAPAPRR